MKCHPTGKELRATQFGEPSCGVWRTTLGDRLVATSFKGPGFNQIRFVAATIVLLHHCHSVEYDIKADLLFTYSGGFLHFGILAVLIFFAISGFLVTPGLVRSGNVVDYATHRALRIFPALAVVVVASMMVLGPVLTTATPAAYFFDPRVYLYGKNILTLTYEYLPGVMSRDGQPAIVNGALWTLHFEILSYIALAIMSLAGMLRKPYGILTIFLATYGLYLAVNFESGVLHWFTGRFFTFVNLFVYFAAGATLYVFRSWIPYSVPLAAFALALLMVALAFGAGAVVVPLCLPYITIVAGLSVLPGHSLVSRDLSYGIYLIHAPVLVGVSLLYPGVLRWWIAAVVVFFITLTSSYLSWTFVEAPALARKKAVSNWANDRLRGIKMTLSRGLARPCRRMIVRDSQLEESLRSSVRGCPGPRRGGT